MRLAHSTILGLAASLALAAPAVAAAKDVNHDALPDGWERAHHLSVKVNQAGRDQDHDGLVNRLEFADKTDPRRADTDRDGVKDGQEDSDHDGVRNRDDHHPGVADHPHADSTSGDDDAAGTDDAGDAETGADGSGEPATPPSLPDHVVSLVDGVLTIARVDGTTVAARMAADTDVECGVQLPGPFHVCGTDMLVPGAKVGAAIHHDEDGVDTWEHVFLTGIGGTAPAPAPASTLAPAPPVTGSVASFEGGTLTVTRPSGEHPSGPLAADAKVRCLTISDGYVVSAVACDPAAALVPGAQLGASQRTLIDGVWSWTTIDVLLAGGGAEQ